MAESILSSLVEQIVGNLSSMVLQEIELASNLKTNLVKLKNKLLPIQAVIQDAEEKQIKSGPLRDWLRNLKDAVYDVDDILDEFATEALRRRAESHHFMQNKVGNFFSPRNPLKFRLNMGHKIHAIVERLDDIAKERSEFNLQEGVTEYRKHDDRERYTSSIILESEIYGREEDVENIVELLLTEVSSQEGVSIYAIVGMGGLGKTTLAQLVYNDHRVQSHFEFRIWVCVSVDFEITRLTKDILESAGGSVGDITELFPMQRRLEEMLSGRRFLLVLDNVWNEDQEEWDRLRHVLRFGAKGSTIIVTTRSKKVASIMATLPAHHLRVLSEDHCWSLFKERAFGSRRKEESPNLIAIGKEIVKKCGGVPLAVKALGGLLRFRSEESEWLSVKESDIWDLSDAESAILPALRLSYNHLPSHLRQCFSFCSIFPKDHEIEKDQLIQLWMANGFIPLKERMELDDMGHEIFNDLVGRCFFQDTVKDDYGNIRACKMHDLMHDLAQSTMGHECFIIDIDEAQKIPRRVRHLSCPLEYSYSRKVDLDEAKSLRTFLLLSTEYVVVEDLIWSPEIFSVVLELFVPYISKQRCLRVLCLTCDKKIPISMDNLKHLRYLDLSGSRFDQLPESLSRLYNLQILKLKNCQQLRKLPKGMRHMSNLRYLDIIGCSSLTHMPIRMGELSCLQTLTRFIICKDNGRRIGELQGLKLKGELSIENLEEVESLAEAKDADLGGKHNLQSLSLSWRNNNWLDANDEEVLKGLQPHQNLKKLCITRYPGLTFPEWMRDLLLPNLIEIRLMYCKRCEDLSSLGKLRLLKVLTIIRMDGVNYIDNELEGDDTIKAFPSLEKLRVNSMPCLEQWTRVEGREIFPCLRKLEIERCPKLITRLQLNFTSLSSLGICGFLELMSLPDGLLRNLTLLESLEISRLPHLKSLSSELDNLVSLKELELRNCAELAYLPKGLRNLTSLSSLTISNCQSLMSLPEEGLEGLSSLQSLQIYECKNLMSLSEGVRHLRGLKYLIIQGCPELTSLPEGLQRLTTLIEFRIEKCPHLTVRCKKESGEDWHKIAHIPNITINDQDTSIHVSVVASSPQPPITFVGSLIRLDRDFSGSTSP